MENDLDDIIKEEIYEDGGGTGLGRKNSGKMSLAGGLGPITIVLAIVATISLALNVILVIKLPIATSLSNDSGQVQDQSYPEPAQGDPQAGVIQTFDITKDDHISGNFDAPVTLVEFSDFECPYCGRHAPTIEKILENYKDQVRVVYKHFPLPFHADAQKAAEASECADEQGKFWEYHDTLFAKQPEGFSVDKFKQWAVDLGLNGGQFNTCLDSDKYAQKVKDDLAEGEKIGIDGTPTNFINGQAVVGAVPYESLAQVIDNELTK